MFLHLKIFCLHWKCDRFGIRIIGSEMILNPFGFAGKGWNPGHLRIPGPHGPTVWGYRISVLWPIFAAIMARQHRSYEASIYSTLLNVWRLLGIVQLVLFVALSWNFHLRSDWFSTNTNSCSDSIRPTAHANQGDGLRGPASQRRLLWGIREPISVFK